jgi:two-component system response regulator NreC
LGARLVTADDAHSEGETLTPREAKVLTLLSQGHTNQEIADCLHISIRTVETHRARIRDKLGAATRADLITAARERGMLA